MDDNPYQPPESNVEAPPPSIEGLAPLPWENRQVVGFGAGLWESFVLFIKDPVQAYARAKESGDFPSPVLYAVIVGTIFGVIAQLWGMVFNASMFSFLGDETAVPMMGLMGGLGALMIIFVPFIVVIGLFIWSAIVHLSLLVIGGLANSKSGFEGTLRAQAYASTTQVMVIIPIVGGFISAIWAIVLNVIGLKRMHGCSTGRAVLAIFLPIMLCCVVGVILAFAIGGIAALSNQ